MMDETDWEVLLDDIANLTIIPILGPDLLQPLVNGLTRSNIAQFLAGKNNFPLDDCKKKEFHEVAQFVLSKKELYHTTYDLIKSMYQIAKGRTPTPGTDLILDYLREELQITQDNSVKTTPWETYNLLASYSINLYISVEPSQLLEYVLKKKGKELLLFIPSLTEPDIEMQPTKPVIFYPFGVLSSPNTMTFARNDFFDYFLGVSSSKVDEETIDWQAPRNWQAPRKRTGIDQRVHPMITTELQTRSLLFLGFETYDWLLHVLLRLIFARPSPGINKNARRFIVQNEPECEDPKKKQAQKTFIEDYFRDQLGNSTVFWGSTEEFCEELYHRYPPPAISKSHEDA